MKIEEIQPGLILKGIVSNYPVTVIKVNSYGPDAIELIYEVPDGRVDKQLLYRFHEPDIEIFSYDGFYSFNANGNLYKLTSEALRINLAYLFDSRIAVHTSLVEPLPHQITAVYGEMLRRQPLRFLLADDPGAGKTIMTGLLIKELIIRGDIERCLICAPGSLVEQWQDELSEKFNLTFELFSREMINNSSTGNPFMEHNFLICRLDQLSRNEDIQNKFNIIDKDWDLVVCDEAHKMSASFRGGEIKPTDRYKLGKTLSRKARHFLLLTATPHNGKDEEFQLFLGLLDEDRFEGKFRDGVHKVDVSDIMRRMVKEELYKFDGSKLFPERRANTVNYTLTNLEMELYEKVTEYVRQGMNRAEKLVKSGQKKRGNTIGFALTILQRRLASSPEAIYQSLKRRKERLERKLKEEQNKPSSSWFSADYKELSDDELEDLEDAPVEEIEKLEEELIDMATPALNIKELEIEIEDLKDLEALASNVRHSKVDRKWNELSSLLQNKDIMWHPNGFWRKIIIFTEHRDTLEYLSKRITTVFGRSEAVVVIHGGVDRDKRRETQQQFTQNKEVIVLLATDAAGEGINLQQANLMVNYDLPWNPNRLEQRFGRIHRIGQTEVCHMWNLVAEGTREGHVFKTLCKKIEEATSALQGKVFDVLGQIFNEKPLKELLIEAIRYGSSPEKQKELTEVITGVFDLENIRKLIEEQALASDVMDVTQIQAIREEMERAEARRLQPHFIKSFFIEAFRSFRGSIKERESGRYEILNVPSLIRRYKGTGREFISDKYHRVCFDKKDINGTIKAHFIAPGHPLLNSVIELFLEKNRELLKRGTLLIDNNDNSDNVRVLFYLDNSICEGRINPRTGQKRTVSREIIFVEINSKGEIYNAGYAPYLNYDPATEEEGDWIRKNIDISWINKDIEKEVLNYTVTTLVPKHYSEVKKYREDMVKKTMAAVKNRLTKEILYWDSRSVKLREEESAGKVNARLNSDYAIKRRDELKDRQKRRLEELELERHISPMPPVVISAATVIPGSLLSKIDREKIVKDTRTSELAGMKAVMEYETDLGYEPYDVSSNKCGYDIESKIPGTGLLRFIEVKAYAPGTVSITVTKNEILTALNKPEAFILALVEVDNGHAGEPVYVMKPFHKEPDFGVASVNYELKKLIEKAYENL